MRRFWRCSGRWKISPRYSSYGTLRLNLRSKIFLRRFQFYYTNRHYGEYFARFYAMILCSFGILIVGAGPYASGSLQAERQWGIDVHIGG